MVKIQPRKLILIIIKYYFYRQSLFKSRRMRFIRTRIKLRHYLALKRKRKQKISKAWSLLIKINNREMSFSNTSLIIKIYINFWISIITPPHKKYMKKIHKMKFYKGWDKWNLVSDRLHKKLLVCLISNKVKIQ